MDSDAAPYGGEPADEWSGPADEIPAPPLPPTTGDSDIDTALERLAAGQSGSLSERVAAGEEALEVLQSRLRDLGGA